METEKTKVWGGVETGGGSLLLSVLKKRANFGARRESATPGGKKQKEGRSHKSKKSCVKVQKGNERLQG